MTKSVKIVITVFLSLLIIGLIIAVFSLLNANTVLSRSLRYNNDHAAQELVSSFDDLATALGKCRYAEGGSVMTGLCAHIYAKAQTAQMALGVLPTENDELNRVADFLSRVGDYSYAASCGMSGDDVYDSLASLSAYGESISEMLHGYFDGQKNDGDASVPVYSDDFKDTKKEHPETPTLIYDGPFSDDVDAGSYSMLDGYDELDEAEILKTVSDKTGTENLRCVGRIDGDIALCVLESGDTRITATVRGGLVMTVKTDQVCDGDSISREDATAKATEYLETMGYSPMVPTYYIVQDNALIVNFAYREGEYICYPDLIKVRVSLTDGCILDMDASGYFRNHKARSIPDETISADECRNIVPSHLMILSEGKAVIPTYGKKEKFCFEYKCENDKGQHYILYADTQNGELADILQLLEDENGILAK